MTVTRPPRADNKKQEGEAGRTGRPSDPVDAGRAAARPLIHAPPVEALSVEQPAVRRLATPGAAEM